MDVYAAQQFPKGPVVLMIATDIIHVVPGKHAGDDPKDLDRFETYGAEVLRNAHAELASTTRIRMFGLDAVQVTGDYGDLRISIRLMYRGYRHFEFRCFDRGPQAEWRCASALTSFRIEDLPEAPAEQDVPQIRHLRDARFHLAFDPPDDSWLSTGPHLAGDGAQVVWIWNKSGRQIDIQAMDLGAMPARPDQESLAKTMADGARTSGDSVVATHSDFAGHRWDHLEMSGERHGKQDLFILVEQSVMYGILVTQPSRDQRLIETAKEGFRIVP
jgi:hypothetical protein